MALVRRQIVRIDESKCNGCGLCVIPCAEGAIELVQGKAKVVREELCDGAGFCLSVCPTGALSVEVREAPEFSRHAAQEPKKSHVAQTCFVCGAGEDASVLLPCRSKGKSVWVCARCLPGLIHGASQERQE